MFKLYKRKSLFNKTTLYPALEAAAYLNHVVLVYDGHDIHISLQKVFGIVGLFVALPLSNAPDVVAERIHQIRRALRSCDLENSLLGPCGWK